MPGKKITDQQVRKYKAMRRQATQEIVELPRFDGHLSVLEKESTNAQDPSSIRAGIPATNHRVGESRTESAPSVTDNNTSVHHHETALSESP